MAIFAIIPQPGPHADKLAPAIIGAFPDAYLSIGSSVWLVAGSGTAQDISNRVGITGVEPNVVGSAVVIEAASYFGRGNPAIWSWIKANWEARPVG